MRSIDGHYYTGTRTRNGYLHVCFFTNGKRVCKRVHRLVAETFIPNPNNLPQVNHRDEDVRNNNVFNLEWCDASYNIEYRERFGKSERMPLFAVKLSTLEVLWFPSQHEASRTLGVRQGDINNAIRGRQKTAKGYWFVNADDNAVNLTKDKFGDSVATEVAELMESAQTA